VLHRKLTGSSSNVDMTAGHGSKAGCLQPSSRNRGAVAPRDLNSASVRVYHRAGARRPLCVRHRGRSRGPRVHLAQRRARSVALNYTRQECFAWIERSLESAYSRSTSRRVWGCQVSERPIVLRRDILKIGGSATLLPLAFVPGLAGPAERAHAADLHRSRQPGHRSHVRAAGRYGGGVDL
jgi:hypothetical protein